MSWSAIVRKSKYDFWRERRKKNGNKVFIQAKHIYVKDCWRCERIIFQRSASKSSLHIITFTQQSNGQQPNGQLHVLILCIQFEFFFLFLDRTTDRNISCTQTICSFLYLLYPFHSFLQSFTFFFLAFYLTIGNNTTDKRVTLLIKLMNIMWISLSLQCFCMTAWTEQNKRKREKKEYKEMKLVYHSMCNVVCSSNINQAPSLYRIGMACVTYFFFCVQHTLQRQTLLKITFSCFIFRIIYLRHA